MPYPAFLEKNLMMAEIQVKIILVENTWIFRKKEGD